eukprot:4227830-Prymnesium_polylepis.1
MCIRDRSGHESGRIMDVPWGAVRSVCAPARSPPTSQSRIVIRTVSGGVCVGPVAGGGRGARGRPSGRAYAIAKSSRASPPPTGHRHRTGAPRPPSRRACSAQRIMTSMHDGEARC